jgi:hypothetical protein
MTQDIPALVVRLLQVAECLDDRRGHAPNGKALVTAKSAVVRAAATALRQLQQEWKDFELDIRDALLQGDPDDINQPTEILAENIATMWKEAQAEVARLRAALEQFDDDPSYDNYGVRPED